MRYMYMYAEDEVVPISGMMLIKCKSFVTQFKGKVKCKGEKYIFIIPVKHCYHYLVMVL